MNAEHWQQVVELYRAALARGPDTRAAFLEQACQGNSELRREIESLLEDFTLGKQRGAGNAQGLVGRSFGHYAVKEKIGAGGMGEVYRAWDRHLERDVALKVLPSDALSSESARRGVRREALALSKLNHPNIAIIHDFNQAEDGIAFLVMEYIRGETLASILRAGPLLEKNVAELGMQIASALQEAHEHGLIHRDLKPGNVIVTPKNQAKVLDFGLAQLMRQDSRADDSLSTHTLNYGVAGTLPYMSPEQLRGLALDARSDIFALGAVLYEMSTGQRPFREQTQVALADAILRKEAAKPSLLIPRLSPDFDSLALKCLEKNPQDRYQSAKEVATDLGRLAAGHAVSSRLTQSATRAKSSTSLVVLPSKIFGAPADAFLTDAIPSFLSTHLSQAGLETKIPPTSLDMERLHGDIGKIAEAYGVNALILSMVQVQGRRLTLNIQFVESDTRRLVWSQEFAGPRGRYLELVRNAAEAIRKAVRPAEESRNPGPSVSNVEEELAFQRGIYYSNLYVNRWRQEDFDLALEALDGVVEGQPNRADAPARMAWLHAMRFGTARVEEFFPEAQKWAMRALEIDGRCGRAWSVLSVVEVADFPRRLQHSLKGAALAERDAFCHEQLSQAIGRRSFLLSLEASRQASRLEPLMIGGAVTESILAAGVGRYEEARARIEYALRIEPDNPLASIWNLLALILEGRTGEAAAAMPRIKALAAERHVHTEWVEFIKDLLQYERSENTGDGAVRLEQLACGAVPFPRWQMTTMGLAGLLARRGETEAAVRVMEKRNRMGLVDAYDYLLLNPDYKTIRRDRRFPELASKARAGFDEAIGILNECRGRGELPRYLETPLDEVVSLVTRSAAIL